MKSVRKKVAQIGAGGFGACHLKNLSLPEVRETMELVAIADPFPISEEIKDDFNGRDVHFYKDYRELLEKEEMDAVIISTPIPCHFEMTAACLKKNLFVYLEKPPVATLPQLNQLISLDPHNRVQVGFYMPSYYRVRKLLDFIRSGSFGKIQSIQLMALWPRPTVYYNRASWVGKLGTLEVPILDGPSTNAMSHYIQLISSYMSASGEFGSKLESVSGEFYRARPIESYDTCSISGATQNGIAFQILMSHAYAGKQDTRISLKTERGDYQINPDMTLAGPDSKIVDECNGIEHDTNPQLKYSHLDFSDLLQRKLLQPRVSLEDCRMFLTIVNAGLESAGDIVSIPSEYKKIELTEVGEFHTLSDILPITENCFEKGISYSDSEAPWAVSPKQIWRYTDGDPQLKKLLK
ncbi:MAG: Gfo/Idh/MocA family oxidoreductase [Chthoniobacterales bacterium]